MVLLAIPIIFLIVGELTLILHAHAIMCFMKVDTVWGLAVTKSRKDRPSWWVVSWKRRLREDNVVESRGAPRGEARIMPYRRREEEEEEEEEEW